MITPSWLLIAFAQTMMNQEITRIRQLLEQTFNGNAWYGQPVMEILDGIPAPVAAAHPLPECHSIWEIVLHMTSWRTFVWQKLRGNEAFDIRSATEDWPPVSHTDEPAWKEALNALGHNQEQLLAMFAAQADDKLTETVSGRSYPFYTLLHGIIQHDAYHAGQIALLKKHLTSGKN